MRLPPLPAFVCLAALLVPVVACMAAPPDDSVAAPAGPTPAKAGHWLDAVPAYLLERLPLLDPNGAVQVSTQPRLGDFFHSDYVRVPVTVRWRMMPHVELTDEINSYYARSGSHTGDCGLFSTTFGAKWQAVPVTENHGGLGFGLDYRTPFTNSPIGLTDGYRHVQPYVTATRVLVADWRLLGYANLAGNFLEHTNLPSNFGRNQLHANSLALAVGVGRQWSFCQTSLTARLASTALTSDEDRRNFQLRPEVAFPLRRNPAARTQILLTLGGRVMWGPDGRQVNTNGGVRVNFRLDRKQRGGAAADFARLGF